MMLSIAHIDPNSFLIAPPGPWLINMYMFAELITGKKYEKGKEKKGKINKIFKSFN